jgi:hypothetical protein
VTKPHQSFQIIIIYINRRGLSSPSKIISLARLVELHKTNVILVQEIMGEGKKVVKSLCKIFRVWDFFGFRCSRKLNGNSNRMEENNSLMSIYCSRLRCMDIVFIQRIGT